MADRQTGSELNVVETDRSSRSVLRLVLLIVAAAGFVLAGANHFINPAFYAKIVPPMFPSPGALVAISGIAEIAGGIGLLVPRLRLAAGWGLILLLIGVFPANLYMALAPERVAELGFPTWALWARLLFQPVFIVWLWYVALCPKRSASRLE